MKSIDLGKLKTGFSATLSISDYGNGHYLEVNDRPVAEVVFPSVFKLTVGIKNALLLDAYYFDRLGVSGFDKLPVITFTADGCYNIAS